MYDINTKNESFLKVSNMLLKHGVKNNKFMLQLNNPELSGVDVYSNSLTFAQKAMIYVEICSNFWYFLREVCRIPIEGTDKASMYGLNLGNLAISFCCIKNINHIAVLPRQQGKTIAEVCFSVWVHYFGTYNTKETYLHKAQSGSIDNLARFKKIKEKMPTWLRELVEDPVNDKDNLEEKFIAKRKNGLQALAAAQTDEAADKLGRGSSTALILADEFAFLDRNEIVYNALLPAWNTSARNAKDNGAPYGIHIITTPNTLSLPQAKFCYSLKENALRFSYSLYDINNDDKLHQFVEDNSDNDFVYIEYSYEELGLTKEGWLNPLIKKYQGNMLIVKRELLLVWPESTEGMLFQEEQFDRINYYKKPISFELLVNDRYSFEFYERPDFSMNYILGCDVAGGLSQDRSVMIILHPKDFHVVGLFANSKINTEEFRSVIDTMMNTYLPHSVLVVENNSYGLAILDSLIKDSSLEPRIYRDEVIRKAEKTMEDGRNVVQARRKIAYGVATNKESRAIMFDILGQLVNDYPEVFVSEKLINEIKTLQMKNTKVQAMSGAHDDIVMAYLICRYAISVGKCFLQRFGISALGTSANVRTDSYTTDATSNFASIVDSANAAAFNDAPQLTNIDYLKDAQRKLDRYNTDKDKPAANDLFMTICNFNNTDN